MKAVKQAINSAATLEVPNHLRNAPVKGMAEQGYGEGHVSPHSAPEGVVSANYFPIGMESQNFYEPVNRGFEVDVRERMAKAKQIIRKSAV
jgi:putative ATPase